MAYALESLAFFGLMTAQAFGALLACLYPWHHVHCVHSSDQAAPLVRGDEPQRAFAP
jgi:hypothetical protein